jgi:hypothetical protein
MPLPCAHLVRALVDSSPRGRRAVNRKTVSPTGTTRSARANAKLRCNPPLPRNFRWPRSRKSGSPGDLLLAFDFLGEALDPSSLDLSSGHARRPANSL